MERTSGNVVCQYGVGYNGPYLQDHTAYRAGQPDCSLGDKNRRGSFGFLLDGHDVALVHRKEGKNNARRLHEAVSRIHPDDCLQPRALHHGSRTDITHRRYCHVYHNAYFHHDSCGNTHRNAHNMDEGCRSGRRPWRCTDACIVGQRQLPRLDQSHTWRHPVPCRPILRRVVLRDIQGHNKPLFAMDHDEVDVLVLGRHLRSMLSAMAHGSRLRLAASFRVVVDSLHHHFRIVHRLPAHTLLPASA